MGRDTPAHDMRRGHRHSVKHQAAFQGDSGRSVSEAPVTLDAVVVCVPGPLFWTRGQKSDEKSSSPIRPILRVVEGWGPGNSERTLALARRPQRRSHGGEKSHQWRPMDISRVPCVCSLPQALRTLEHVLSRADRSPPSSHKGTVYRGDGRAGGHEREGG